MLKLIHRREYFDACLLHSMVHDVNVCKHSRPIFRVSQYTNRSNITFNPLPSNNDFGLFRDPAMRTQLLYERKFKSIDVLNPNIKTYKVALMGQLKNSIL